MKKRSSKNKKIDIAFYIIISILSIGVLGFGLKIYLDHVEKETNKILEKTDTDYITKNITLMGDGLYKVNLKSDLLEYLKTKNVSSVTYKIEGEKVYFDISINEKDGNYSIWYGILFIIN